jgi:hypothetical protein
LIAVFTPFINRLLHRPSIDLALSGGLSGKLTQLSDWHGFSTSCQTEQGGTMLFALFPGTMSSDHVVFFLVVTPYQGAGSYSEDTSSRSDPYAVQPVRILVSTIPESASHGAVPPAGGIAYTTQPTPQYPSLSPPDEAGTSPGKVNLRVNPGETSGRVDAWLDFGTSTAGTPVHVTGTFNCGVLERAS